jgi:hypothetical protein
MDPAEMVFEEDRRDIADSPAGDGEGYSRLVRRYQDKVVAQMWRFTRDTVVLTGQGDHPGTAEGAPGFEYGIRGAAG